MKIKLTCDLPVDAKHGCKKGRVFDVARRNKGRGRPRWFVTGDTGEEVGVLSHEAEEIKTTK